MRLSCLTTVLLFAVIFSSSANAATALFNCGGPAYTAGEVTYQADQMYTTENGAGALDGTAEVIQINQYGVIIANTEYAPLFYAQRQGLTGYRFDVPNGLYLLTMGFTELQENGPGLRVFTVSAQGKPLLTNFDIYGTVEKNLAVTYQFAVVVTTGQLDVTFAASVGQTTISTIGVAPLALSTTAPPTPANVSTLNGYYRNILSWPGVAARDLAGYLVSKSANQTGPYTLLTTTPTPVSRYFDDAVTPGVTAYYKVAAIDVFGNISAPSTPVSATPIDSTVSTLPVFQLSITPANLAILQADPESDTYVDADFYYAGVEYAAIGVRYHGQTSREYEKKSYKINFNKSQEFGTQDKLNFKADGSEPAIFRECLGATVIRQTASLIETCTLAHFELNGEYVGVFNNLENIDQYFLSDHGQNPNGKLFEAKVAPQANFQILPDYSVAWDDDSADQDGYDTLSQFINTINNTSDADFPSVISSVLDVQNYLDYCTSIILDADFDHVDHNFEMNLNPDSLIWQIIGKDFDQSFRTLNLAIDYGTAADPSPVDNTYNILTNRLLNVPLFQQWYVNKLAERLETDFTPDLLDPVIASDHATILSDALVDVYKVGRESNTPFDSSATDLDSFVAQRRPNVNAQLASYNPGLAPSIELNEVLAINVNGITDSNGDHAPWLEIYNPTATEFDLTGYYLTDNPAVPTTFQFPNGLKVAAGGYQLIWLDGQTSEGPLHASFAVNPLGQALAIYGPTSAGNPLVDTVAFGPQTADTSFGRRYSGSWLWAAQTTPSPLAPNRSVIITDAR